MKQFKFTLRITVFLSLTILMFISSVMLISISVIMGRSSVENVLDNLIRNVSLSVTEKTIDFLEPALMVSQSQFTQYNLSLARGGALSVENCGPVALKSTRHFEPALLARYGLSPESLAATAAPRISRMKTFIDFSTEMCRIYDQVSKIHTTDFRSLDFAMVKKMDDGSTSTTWRLRLTTPTGVRVVVTLWDHANAEYYNAAYINPKTGRKINYANGIEPESGAYDPRQRPWFTAAVNEYQAARAAGRDQRPAWTPAYVFFSDETPGITCSLALGRMAVDFIYCVDIGIIDISTKYLANLNVGIHGKVFILNEIGEIIAYNPYAQRVTDPVRQQALVKDEIAKLIRQIPKYADPANPKKITGYDFQLTSITNSPNDLYKVAFEQSGISITSEKDAKKGAKPDIRLSVQKQFSFDYRGTPFIGSFAPFPGSSAFRWIVGIVIPEDDFMTIAKKNTVILVVVSIIMLALSIVLALWISNGITLNLKKLVAETDNIRVFNLDNPVTIESHLIEIHQLGEAFHNMETGLRSFSKYVPSDVVRFVVQSGAEAVLGGEKRVLTVFFSDIADFTTIAEGQTPDALVRYLGTYLSEMSDIIIANNGTIDKYIGDSIMAFWNAPTDCADHAYLACKTAVECQARLADLRAKKWKDAGHPLFSSRFGINTGELIVGNMGSDKRLNYTVIGDAVNLASRIEGINKLYGTGVICSENTHRELKGRMETRILDVVTVKGKKEPVSIYEVCGLAGHVPAMVQECNRKYSEAFNQYTQRRFADARKLLAELLARNPGDGAAKVLMARCERYIQNAPGPEWNKVWELTEK